MIKRDVRAESGAAEDEIAIDKLLEAGARDLWRADSKTLEELREVFTWSGFWRESPC